MKHIFKIAICFLLVPLFQGCSGDDNGGSVPPEEESMPPVPALSIANLNEAVAENPENGAVVAQFEIVQENLTDGLTIELLEVSRMGAVTVNNQGQLLVADAAAFDFERRETISGQVRASSGALQQTATFTFNITDQVEDAIPFITRWELETADRTIQLPLYPGSAEDPTEYDFRVDWGDGSEEGLVTSFDDPDASHTYSFGGVKTVTITGKLKGFNFSWSSFSREKLIDITEWGDMELGNAGSHFSGCENLLGFTAADTPILKLVTNMEAMFFEAFAFNGDVSDWDVSNVTTMRNMFTNAQSFNRNLSSWDVSNVTDMLGMFASAKSFNEDLSSWNVSNVTTMRGMFFNTDIFNQDLSSWDVSNVSDMRSMFNSSSFNNDISNWDVSNVTDMHSMFSESTFNGDISNWDVSNVLNMRFMFNLSVFNGDISNWDVSKVTDMGAMFQASSFNGDISNWDVSNVTDMIQIFNFASFDGDISNWDVSKVTNMGFMLANSAFDGDISNWDVSNATNMSSMFLNASFFNQDLSEWDTTNVEFCNNFSTGSALQAEHLPTLGPCFGGS